ncbi:hypothetical protein [Streptomyces collinus]|uniref:hypothetical protein n=1 Tax=Streptomyces collinus TaxID=42684 RepID=UPI0036CEC201
MPKAPSAPTAYTVGRQAGKPTGSPVSPVGAMQATPDAVASASLREISVDRYGDAMAM